jgi:hypothetical protein
MNERPAKDLIVAHGEIHWPKGFANLIDAGETAWYSSGMQIGSADKRTLHADTTFTWKTFGFPIQSKVNEFVPFKRLGWFGEGTGIRAYQPGSLSKRAAVAK